MAKRREEAAIQPKVFETAEEIDRATVKLERRITELNALDVNETLTSDNGADEVAASNLRETILDIFGPNSPEYREHRNIQMWTGPMFMEMSHHEIVANTERGRVQMIGIVRGLVQRLKEKREDLTREVSAPRTYFDELKLHPRIADVTRDLFMDGHQFEAVFAAAKALVNYVKERSGKHDLDGAPLMRTVFSKNMPILAFNDLKNQTEQDEQEGMMHLFEGSVLGIRNPGGHSFPEGTEQRAIEYISLLSLLAYRVQETKKNR